MKKEKFSRRIKQILIGLSLVLVGCVGISLMDAKAYTTQKPVWAVILANGNYGGLKEKWKYIDVDLSGGVNITSKPSIPYYSIEDYSGKKHNSIAPAKGTKFLYRESSGDKKLKYWVSQEGSVRNIEGGIQSNKKGRIRMENVDATGSTPYIRLPQVSKRGYTFTGWSVTETQLCYNHYNGAYRKFSGSNPGVQKGSDGYYYIKVGAYSNIRTVKPTFKANTYTVRYHANGGSGSMANTTVTYGTSKNLTPNTFTRTGYNFVNWKAYRTYDNTWSWNDGNGGMVWKTEKPTDAQAYQYKNGGSVATSTPSGYLDLYAMWTPKYYTVTFVDGLGNTLKTQSVAYGSSATPPTSPTRIGYTFSGWSGSYTNITGSRTITATWTVNNYSNSIAHWMFGFKHSEGNNGDKSAWLIKSTSFNQPYNSKYTMDASRAVSVPKGFYLKQSFGTSSINGSWTNYNFGTQVTQKTANMSFEYDYLPATYKITYNLNGGVNNTSNPSTYNILYGVTLQNPTRPGWKFDGWYIGGQKVTGINSGANATFADESDMRNKLNSRTIGDKTIEAKWLPLPIINGPILDNCDDNPIAPFMSGNNLVIQQGDTFTPLKYVTATDPVEGEAITSKIKVKSMTLPLDNGRANTTGTFTVTYSVTNNAGVTAEKIINVLVNEPPKITGPNVRHKLIHESIDESFLLSQQSANDKEDSNITPKLGLKMIKDEMNNVIDRAEDIDTRYVGEYKITITVTDKYKKTVDKTYTLKIVKDDYKYEESHDTEFRFISKDFLDTLSKNSSFSINTTLHQVLENSLSGDKTPQKIVRIPSGEISKVKQKLYKN